MPSELAAVVKRAVETGDYSSAGEVVQAALSEWKMRYESHLGELAALKADIDAGLADRVAGRIRDFDSDRIAERGRTLLAARSPSG